MKLITRLLIALAFFVPVLAHAADAKRIVIDGGVPFCTFDLNPSAQKTALDSADDNLAWTYQMPQADTITDLCYRYGNRAATPPTYKISLMGVSATTGGSDGTILGGGSPAEKTFTPPANTTIDDTWVCQTLVNSIAVTRGQWVAVDIRHSSGTIDGTNNSSFTGYWSNCGSALDFPLFTRVLNAGAISKFSRANVPTFALKSATKTYGQPILSFTRDNFSSDSNPDEYGMAFTLDSGWCTSAKVVGVQFNMRLGDTGKTYKAVLYSNTTALQDVTVDTDYQGANLENGAIVTIMFDETTLSTLSCGTEYIVALQAQSTSTNMSLYTWDSNAAAELSAWGGQTNLYLKTRVDAGSWTSTTTKRPAARLILEDITNSGGGGTSPPAMGRFNVPFN